MPSELDTPKLRWMAWYVAVYQSTNKYLHDDGSIHEGVTVVDKQSNCLSTAWFNSEQEAWFARSAYYRTINIPDTLCSVTKTLDDDENISHPLFDD